MLPPRKFRRAKTPQVEKTQQLIVFSISQDWFALPIQATEKVIPMQESCGDPHDIGVSLTIYQGKELLVLDVIRHVFGVSAHPLHGSLPALANSEDLGKSTTETRSRYLLIVRTLHHTLLGFPINLPPIVRRVPLSAFTPLPADYATRVNIQCVNSLVVESGFPPLFLLDTEQLVQSRPQLLQAFTDV